MECYDIATRVGCAMMQSSDGKWNRRPGAPWDQDETRFRPLVIPEAEPTVPRNSDVPGGYAYYINRWARSLEKYNDRDTSSISTAVLALGDSAVVAAKELDVKPAKAVSWLPPFLAMPVASGDNGVDRAVVPSPRDRRPRGASLRLRPRGRLTRSLESAVSETLMSLGGGGGFQTSRNLAGTWVRTILAGGAKLAGHQQVTINDQEGVSDELLTLRWRGGEMLVSLSLFARVFNYCVYRPRTAELLPSLRSRCIQYGKELGASPEYVALVTPGVVALAMQVLPIERSAWATLGERQGRVTAELSRQFVAGAAPRTHIPTGAPIRSFWDRFRHIDTLLVGGRMTRGFQLVRER